MWSPPGMRLPTSQASHPVAPSIRGSPWSGRQAMPANLSRPLRANPEAQGQGRERAHRRAVREPVSDRGDHADRRAHAGHHLAERALQLLHATGWVCLALIAGMIVLPNSSIERIKSS
jgi:hypothetical protein